MSSAAAVTDASFEQDVLKSDVPVLVDFWATWCGPCKTLGPTLEKVVREANGKIKLTLSADGLSAAGLIAGYRNWRDLYAENTFAQDGGQQGTREHEDAVALYYALRRNADGMLNPRTGRFDGISSAYRIKLSSAYVVDPEKPMDIPKLEQEEERKDESAAADSSGAPWAGSAMSIQFDIDHRSRHSYPLRGRTGSARGPVRSPNMVAAWAAGGWAESVRRAARRFYRRRSRLPGRRGIPVRGRACCGSWSGTC